VNSCDIHVVSSNVASNISLRLDKEDSKINLSWNAYRHWPAPVADYRLFLDTGAGFSMKAVLDAADSTYSVNYSDIMYQVSGDRICMYIVAEEEMNQYGFSGTSVSSTACTEPEERITVPNLFTPNGDLLNDSFKPVLSFVPAAYHLVVSNRKGITLFESRDYNEAWNGRGSGNNEPDGVCLWFLSVTTTDGKKITRKGTVTILANP
jgi:gliding motility-associated-like protein